MRPLTKILSLLGGLVIGVILSLWYLGHSVADKSAMKMLVFIPLFDLYEPTFTDYLIPAAIAAAGMAVVYYAINRLCQKLMVKKPHPAP